MTIEYTDEATQDKRALPVESPAPDEATRLQRKLTPRLSEEDEEKLAHRILTDYRDALSDRSEWESRLAEWEDAYYNRVKDKDFPWPGAANFHVPLTMMGVETYKPRLVEAVLGQIPPIIAVPATQGGEERKEKVETVLNWQVLGQLKLESKINQSAHLYLQPGIVYAKVIWKVDRIRRKMVREFPAQTPLPAVFEAIFGTDKPRNLEQTGDLQWTGEIYTSPQGGQPLEVKLEVAFLDDPASIQVLVDREEVTERPFPDLIEPIDVIVPAKGGHEVMEQPWIQHRLWYTEDDLRRKVLAGRFYADVVEELLETGAPRGDQPATDSQAYRASQDAAEGVEGQGPSNVRRTEWDILEDYRRWDIDGDGLDEEIITWVSEHAPGRVLGWDYLDNVYAHGMRPIVVGRFFPVPFRWYGLSYAEMVKGIQDEINSIHNQRTDYGTIRNLPFGFKRASSTIPPISQRLKPGEFIDVDNPKEDIFIPNWQGSSAEGSQDEATLMQYHERLSGLTDLSVGRQPNRVGATRTASGTQTLLSESGLRFKTAMQGFQRFWLQIFEQMLALDQEYLPPAQEFRITGKQPAVVRVKDRTEIRGKFDLRLAATSETMNRQRMRDDATVLMQMAMNPALLQLGIMGKKGLRKSVEDLYKAFGKDPSFYIEDQATPMSAAAELMHFAAGTYVPPVAGPHLQANVQVHQQELQLPYIRPEVKQMIQRYIQEAQQALQVMQMSQMMQQNGKGAPPVGQQAQNAETGKQPQPGPASVPGQTSQGAGMAPQVDR